MLIEMYYHFVVCACMYMCTIVFTFSQFHTDIYSDVALDVQAQAKFTLPELFKIGLMSLLITPYL